MTKPAGRPGTSTTQRERAVMLFAAGMSFRDVAEEVGIGVGTAWRWFHDADFRTRVDAQRELIAAGLHTKLQTLGADALDALRDVLHDKDAEHRDRIAAAKAILDRVVPATQKHEVKAAAEMSTEQIEAELRKLGYKRAE